jgi:hypothetical protein
VNTSIRLSPFDYRLAEILSEHREKTISALVSDLLRSEAALEMVIRNFRVCDSLQSIKPAPDADDNS